MQLSELFTPALSFTHLEGRSKKRLFETVAKKISDNIPSLDSDKIFESLTERERLGSTGLGDGVAVPHCRLEGLEKAALGALAQLDEPIDFDSPDQKPVDIVAFLLVAPDTTQGHLDALAAIAARLSEADCREKMRAAETPQELLDLMLSG
jgi:PTS system nitrogen regulatory IIA component